MAGSRDLRVLVIDDSAYNRRVMGDIVEQAPGLTLIGKARDGEEGLQLALTEKPDVITLDLEMPRMDGFTFLRLLMVKRPTPVIVISCHSEREKVFRALELGAIDFVAKPTHRISPKLLEIRDEVIKKIRLAKTGKLSIMPPPSSGNGDAQTESLPRGAPGSAEGLAGPPTTQVSSRPMAHRLIALAASTGGPPAITQVLAELDADLPAALAVIQHMPAKFTAAFAQRLDNVCKLAVKEADRTDSLLQGTVYVAPGQSCLEVRPGKKGYIVHTAAPDGSERYLPSADRLFKSAALSLGPHVLAIVLTGMGDDGARGVKAVAAAGGRVVAEDESTTVIPGMPRAAVLSGSVHQIVPLDQIARLIQDFVHTW